MKTNTDHAPYKVFEQAMIRAELNQFKISPTYLNQRSIRQPKSRAWPMRKEFRK